MDHVLDLSKGFCSSKCLDVWIANVDHALANGATSGEEIVLAVLLEQDEISVDLLSEVLDDDVCVSFLVVLLVELLLVEI